MKGEAGSGTHRSRRPEGVIRTGSPQRRTATAGSPRPKAFDVFCDNAEMESASDHDDSGVAISASNASSVYEDDTSDGGETEDMDDDNSYDGKDQTREEGNWWPDGASPVPASHRLLVGGPGLSSDAENGSSSPRCRRNPVDGRLDAGTGHWSHEQDQDPGYDPQQPHCNPYYTQYSPVKSLKDYSSKGDEENRPENNHSLEEKPLETTCAACALGIAPAPPPVPRLALTPKSPNISIFPARRNINLKVFGAVGKPTVSTCSHFTSTSPVKASRGDAQSYGPGISCDSHHSSAAEPLRPTTAPSRPTGTLQPRDETLREKYNRKLTTSHSQVNLALSEFRAPTPPSPQDTPTLPHWSPGTAERKRQHDQDRREAARWADEVARLEAETDRILAEQKKRDVARLHTRAANTLTPLRAPPSSKPKSIIILEKLNFLGRGKRTLAQNRTFISGSSQPPTPTTATSTTFSFQSSRDVVTPEPSPERMNFIERGGGGIVPQTDAPLAAVNGGERRLTVRCLSSTINLPVTPETTPVDVVYSTANLTTHNINTETAVVVECYAILGLERRIRRYERVRDVMNSWDRDQQNSLLVLSYEDPPDDKDLNISSVSRTSDLPSGFTFHLWHSSRPGKWTKRWVTLLESGQMFASKKAESKPSDKDSNSLCHLSDFDIYMPRESEMRRHLKPPKKHCYAIKSQQKTVVFPDGENFVHFFSTEDSALAQRFYELVHGWRSWYLVNKKVDLSEKDVARDPEAAKRQSAQSPMDANPYTIGQLQPLIDMTQFDKPLEEFGKATDSTPEPAHPASPPSVSRNLPTRSKSHSASVRRQKTLNKDQPPVPTSIPNVFGNTQEFASDGLLGENYDRRRLNENSGPEMITPKKEGPFTEGPSLLNNLMTSPRNSASEKMDGNSWFPSATEHTARQRTESVNQDSLRKRPPVRSGTVKGQPLVNLRDAPPRQQENWRSNVSHGAGIRPPAPGPLINFASGGTVANQPSGTVPPSRGVPRSNSGGMTPNRSPSSARRDPSSSRQRSKSTGGGGTRRMAPDAQRGSQPPVPPVPPMPSKSTRRAPNPSGKPTEERGRRDYRPQEPLIKRAG